MISESTVSSAELSEFFALTELWGENSVSSSQPSCLRAEANLPIFAEFAEVAQNSDGVISSETVLCQLPNDDEQRLMKRGRKQGR